MLISEFIQNNLNVSLPHQQRALLDALAGRTIHETEFYENFEEASDWMKAWMPIYFLPIGENFPYFGLDLRPEFIDQGKLTVVQAENSGLLEGLYIQVGTSLENYLYRLLLKWEATLWEAEEPLDEMQEAVDLFNGILGEHFYQPGCHGTFLPGDVKEILIRENRSCAIDYADKAKYGPEEGIKQTLQDGIEKHPDCFHLYAKLVKQLCAEGDEAQAAAIFNQSLKQYYCTSYHTDLEQYCSLGRELLERFPIQFDTTAQLQFSWQDPKTRMRDLLSFFTQGDLRQSAKLLDDFGYDLHNYEIPIFLDTLRTHYERLGWHWAVALVDHRQSPPQSDLILPTQEHPPFWTAVVTETIAGR